MAPRGPAAEGVEADGRGRKPAAEGVEADGRGRKPDAEGGEANGRGVGSLPQGRKPDGRTLPLSGALSGGQQDLYNFPKMKWQTCGKHSES